MEEKEAFDDVIFTDESIVQLECHWQKYFQKKKTPRKLIQGATQLVIFDWIMNANRYGDILKASIVPFINKSYPECHHLYQDNDPKHTSKYIQQFFQLNGINWWKSPTESPDLNPIEKV